MENINLLKLRLEGGKPAMNAILKSLMDEEDFRSPIGLLEHFFMAMANRKMNFIWKYEGERHDKIP